MPNLYIISGCNGAGKTTASFTVLPEILNCREFVNADNIAAGISPFNPESVKIEAGRIMIAYAKSLVVREVYFILAANFLTDIHKAVIKAAQVKGYTTTLFYSSFNQSKITKGNFMEPEAEKNFQASFENTDFASRILEGIRRANRKMVEAAAVNNESLIVGDDKGGFKAVPAKELLAKLDK
jgi:predicted secreted protein